MTVQEHHDIDDTKTKIRILRKSIDSREVIVRLYKDNKSLQDYYDHHLERINEEKAELAAIKKIYPELFV